MNTAKSDKNCIIILTLNRYLYCILYATLTVTQMSVSGQLESSITEALVSPHSIHARVLTAAIVTEAFIRV